LSNQILEKRFGLNELVFGTCPKRFMLRTLSKVEFGGGKRGIKNKISDCGGGRRGFGKVTLHFNKIVSHIFS
jgi:hypothetical protein